MADASSLKRTPLYECHLQAEARLVPFGGWEMPVQYSGVLEEHRAVRSAAGLFDVSHMGEVRLRGAGALPLLQRLTPNDLSKLGVGRAHYNALLTERGTYIDDLLVYRLGEEDYLLVVNAANAGEDVAWMRSHAGSDVSLEDVSERYALLALQGPRAEEILAALTPANLGDIRYYGFSEDQVAGRRALISRTGYTGEDGFELYVDAPDGAPIWDALLAAGEPHGLRPAGLGARDTLRLEAGMALYGHEIDAETTPYEAGLGWTVKLAKGDFFGRDVLAEQKETGPERRLMGFEVQGRGIARAECPVLEGETEVARVASGTWSPTLEKAIGTVLLPTRLAEAGTELTLAVRKRRLTALVVPLPFYRRDR